MFTSGGFQALQYAERDLGLAVSSDALHSRHEEVCQQRQFARLSTACVAAAEDRCTHTHL